MLTECPSCKTVFRVTPAILKMGHGQVRCGQCRKQFDAIECMLDEEDGEVAEQERIPPPKATAKTAEFADDGSVVKKFDGPTYAEEVIMEGSRIEISGTYRIPGADGDANGESKEVIREHVVIDRDDMENDSNAADDWLDDLSAQDETASDNEAFAAHEESQSSSTEMHGVIEAPPLPNRWRRSLLKNQETEEIHAELHALTKRGKRRVLRTGVWTVIGVILAITLFAQIIHHNRDALVRDPRFGAAISRIYRTVGLSPAPHWDLAAYKWDIYKVNLDPQAPDSLRVVGSVANDAPFAQPYPLGKLSLQDRWGSPVGEREFEPQEYLPSPEAANRLMAPKQRANIEIVIADPGADAVGYVIHACLEQDRRLQCADELPVFKK